MTIFDVSSQNYYLGPVNLGECELRLMMAAPPTVDGGGFMQLKVSTCPSTKPVWQFRQLQDSKHKNSLRTLSRLKHYKGKLRMSDDSLKLKIMNHPQLIQNIIF